MAAGGQTAGFLIRTALCLMPLLAAASDGGARWLHLGDTAPTASWPSGEIRIDLDSLRQRGKRYEIWDRTIYRPEPARQWVWRPEDGPPERKTLWSIRCSRMAMAVITRGLAGAFEPRSEKLRYYVPAPGSADAAVLDATCAHIRTATAAAEATSAAEPRTEPAAPEPETAPPALSNDERQAAWRILERPPQSYIDDDEDD